MRYRDICVSAQPVVLWCVLRRRSSILVKSQYKEKDDCINPGADGGRKEKVQSYLRKRGFQVRIEPGWNEKESFRCELFTEERRFPISHEEKSGTQGGHDCKRKPKPQPPDRLQYKRQAKTDEVGHQKQKGINQI